MSMTIEPDWSARRVAAVIEPVNGTSMSPFTPVVIAEPPPSMTNWMARYEAARLFTVNTVDQPRVVINEAVMAEAAALTRTWEELTADIRVGDNGGNQ
jgi:hypothetical protein